MNNGVLAVLDEAIKKTQFTLNWFTEGDVQQIKEARITTERMAEALSNLIERFDSEIHNEYDGTSMLAERLAEADPARAALAAFNGERP